ncbi:BF3164 family lipoprotein [Bacteroides thetaiotaomicron]|uniref:BF3164 family lipoprotein n=1 Tax=Bacteroides thetaiotaomicron TaxID=818 RepID=UPI001F218B5F|nr:BF3164 family lipoprotein [Bacteroides thetaiotaomicron]MCE9222273.1 TolB-like 6-bladed beta-propeller domain-containing protein [Bacteroides thetaiotaomicron]MCS3197284.1 TolB-like 6-bladed beta-propeller domain-containing protein [Bacteroides thetaiotaomicron]
MIRSNTFLEDIVLKIFISFLLLFICISCGTKNMEYTENVFPYSEFPQEKELKGEVIELDTALFRCPFRIRVEGDKAIVMDLHGIDYYAHLFQYPSFRYLSSLGRRGDSPTEMLSIENVRFYNHQVWTLDANKRELTRLGFSSSSDSLLRDEAVTLGEDILRPLDFAIYNDTSFIIPDYSGENRICLINRDGRLINKIGTIPTVKKKALQNARPALAQAWRSFLDYNPHNGVLAMVTQLGEVLEVYNLKDSTSVVRIGENGEPEFKISDGYGIPTGIMGFSDVQVTDSAIYAVFHGTTFKEIAKQNGHLPDGGKFIYVFSLKGEPLCKYILDHYIYGIWVDEATKTIITTDINNDQPIVKLQYG